MSLPTSLRAIWEAFSVGGRQKGLSLPEVWTDEDIFKILMSQDALLRQRKVKPGEVVGYMGTGKTSKYQTVRSYGGSQKVLDAFGETEAGRVADSCVYGDNEVSLRHVHLQPGRMTPWFKEMQRDSIRVFVVFIAKNQEEGIEKEAGWGAAVFAAKRWACLLAAKAENRIPPKFRTTPVRAAYFARIDMEKEEEETLITQIDHWGPQWRASLYDEEGF